jgi:hypothetical protein
MAIIKNTTTHAYIVSDEELDAALSESRYDALPADAQAAARRLERVTAETYSEESEADVDALLGALQDMEAQVDSGTTPFWKYASVLADLRLAA